MGIRTTEWPPLARADPLTYGELRTQVDASRTALAGRGVRRGRPGGPAVWERRPVRGDRTWRRWAWRGRRAAQPLQPRSGARGSWPWSPRQRRSSTPSPGRPGTASTGARRRDRQRDRYRGHDLVGRFTLEELLRSRAAATSFRSPMSTELAAPPVHVGHGGPLEAAMLTHGNLRANIEQILASRTASSPATSSSGCCRCTTSSASTSCSASPWRGRPVVLVERFDPPVRWTRSLTAASPSCPAPR